MTRTVAVVTAWSRIANEILGALADPPRHQTAGLRLGHLVTTFSEDSSTSTGSLPRDDRLLTPDTLSSSWSYVDAVTPDHASNAAGPSWTTAEADSAVPRSRMARARGPRHPVGGQVGPARPGSTPPAARPWPTTLQGSSAGRLRRSGG